jgi:hypothetical protein
MFKPGDKGNPNGRPIGSRNRRTAEVFSILRARGDTDPADYFSSVLSNKNNSEELRMAAARELMPYMYSKAGTLPALTIFPTARFSAISEAEDYLAALPSLFSSCEIDAQSALDLSQLIRNWIEAKRDGRELEIKVSNADPAHDHVIKISGGLPRLPGTSIEMPVKLPVRPDSNLADPDLDDAPPQPTTIDSVANQAPPPGANADQAPPPGPNAENGISMPFCQFTPAPAQP